MKRFLAVLVAASMLAGCAIFGSADRSGVSASLVDFLYPKNETPEAVTDEVPHLQVPLTVGLAFVPSNCDCAPSGVLQAQLLERVRERFAGRNYIREIKVIPATYMRAGKGFVTLEQLSRLYGFDVIALVSYDQVSLSSQRTSALLYWTIVGEYVIKGHVNDVHTFVDTAVLDVKTRKLLLRAPGIDVRAFNGTSVGNDREVARQQGDAMGAATEQMIANLDAELATFRERIKTDNSVIVTRRPGSSSGGGAGSMGWLSLGMLLLAVPLLRRAR